MRLWSIHPKYLDSKGLVALWREALLAQKVLLGKTRGYKNHPQLIRFKSHPFSLAAINVYLFYVLQEGLKRGYHFSESKVLRKVRIPFIKVTQGQVNFELKHLKSKLRRRDILAYGRLLKQKPIKVHPLFRIINGGIEFWEKTS